MCRGSSFGHRCNTNIIDCHCLLLCCISLIFVNYSYSYCVCVIVVFCHIDKCIYICIVLYKHKFYICIVIYSWIYPNYRIIVSSVFIASSIKITPPRSFFSMRTKKDLEFRILNAIKKLFLPPVSKRGLPYPASDAEAMRR